MSGFAAGARDRTLDTVVELRDTFDLLLDRRLGLVLLVDGIFLLRGFLAALVEEGGSAHGVWVSMVVFPSLLLCLPTLSSTVAVERRAGTLDLVLASGSPTRYFAARIARVVGLFALQGIVLLLVLARERGLGIVLLQCVLTHLFVGAVALFWTVRLRSAGAALAAMATTVALFLPWIGDSAFRVLDDVFGELAIQGPWAATREIAVPFAVLGLATSLFSLYARAHLRRLESLLD